MRKLTLTALVALASLTAVPAFALDCDSGQGRAVELDFAQGTGNLPLLNIGPRVIGERCVDGPSVYQLKGMVGTFSSASQALDAFNTVRKLKGFGLTPENIAAIMKFVGETEARVAAK